jgi:hypothetical protein
MVKEIHGKSYSKYGWGEERRKKLAPNPITFKDLVKKV